MKIITIVIFLNFFLINKVLALIEVDITRGNLDPLPIAVSPLHAVVAGAPLFNGGRLVQPSFIKVEDDSNTIHKQVLEPSTSEKIKKLMYKNVVDGSATRASVDGIFVGGKSMSLGPNK